MKKKDVPVVTLRPRGRNSINVIVQVPKPCRWTLVSQLSGHDFLEGRRRMSATRWIAAVVGVVAVVASFFIAPSAIAGQYTVSGESCNGMVIPGSEGGTVVGGPLNGTIIWSMAFYTSVPNSEGSIIVSGPLNGTRIPGSKGGTIVGGPLNGTVVPGSEGGMVTGGPLNGTRMPGSKGGTIAGGPLNGIVMPPHYSPLQLICEWWATKERSDSR